MSEKEFEYKCKYERAHKGWVNNAKRLRELQEVYDIAMKEIARLRKLLGYDSSFTRKVSNE